MLRDLDINEEDEGGLPSAAGGTNRTNNSGGGSGEENNAEERGDDQAADALPPHLKDHPFGGEFIAAQKLRQQLDDGFEKMDTSERYNHRIHRAYITGKLDLAKRLIDEMLERSAEAVCEFAYMTRALIAREEGQIRESMAWLNKAAAFNPYSRRLIYELGRTYLLLGDHEKACERFQKCIESDPNDWKAYYWKATALCHRNSKKPQESINEAQECLLLCPRLNKCVSMLLFVAKTCIQRNDIAPAIEAYTIAQELEPENLEVTSHLGLLFLKAGSEERAFSCLGRALTYDPSHIPSIIAAATVLQMNGDFDVALSKYRIAALECNDDGILWNNIGLCFLGKGKLVAAISCLKRANYLCPLDWKILFNLAVVYSAMMQYASAYAFMSSALNLNPRNKYLLAGLAVILSQLNDHTNTRKAYKRALQMDENDFIVRLNFSIFEFHRGNMEEAVHLIQNVSPPRNIDHPQFSDLKHLAERFRSALRRIQSN